MPILDVNGNPISSKKPIMNAVAVTTINDKYSTYPSNGLTPERLANIFKEADAGYVYRQMELFEEMEEKDTHLFSVLQTRKNAVMGLDFDVMPYSDDPKDKQIAEFVTECFDNITSLEDIFLDLLDAIGKGFSTSEIMWAMDGDNVVVDNILWRHQKNFFYDTDDILKVRTDDNTAGIEIPANKFIIHRYKARSGHPTRAGILRVCAWMYLFKNYDVKDWVAFAEVYGMPLRLGKYGPNTSEPDKKSLMEALVMLGSDAAGIISDTTSIEFHEANKSSSQDIYEALANFCNKEMSKAILGQTLTTEIGSSGSYAASKTQDGVRQDLKEADCKALARTLQRDLIRPLCFFNFNEDRKLPWIKFHYEEPEDLKSVADTYSVLIKDVHLPVSTDYLYEKFGIPKPQANQEVVKGDVPPVMQQQTPFKNDTSIVKLKDDAANNIDYQKTIDNLADNATSQSIPMFKKMFEPILKLMDKVGSLEELKQKLPEIYPEMDTSELEDLVGKTMFMADLIGRIEEDGLQHTE